LAKPYKKTDRFSAPERKHGAVAAAFPLSCTGDPLFDQAAAEIGIDKSLLGAPHSLR
jgi:hypothetical protein